MSNLPKTICMLPWVSIETSPIGTARPCCMAVDEITKPDGTVFKLKEHTLEEIYKSDYMQKLRRDFRAGEKPETCRRCWDEEAAGRDSKRINSQIRLKEWLPAIEWENDTPDQLWFVDLKLGNICNLKCRICGSWSSSKWAEEEIKYVPSLKNKKEHLAYTFLQQGRWPRESDAFWANLTHLLPQIKYFEFTGGEPWMIKEHFDLLKFAADEGHASHIEIHYNTNGTQFPEHAEELWGKFKRVDIAFSIDNVGDRFEFERYGAKWLAANEIIDKTHALRGKYKNITTQLCLTLNIQNVYYLEELINWALPKRFDSIYFNMMHSPEHMSIACMTPAAQELVVNRLRSGNWIQKHRAEIENIIQFIKNGPGSDGTEFVRRMKQTDQYRKQDFMKTHPEIASAMGY